MRAVYRCLLWMHPPAFRREFAAQMLCIFDEASAGTGTARLLSDALISVLRQWGLRSAAWLLLAALTGALFQMTAGGLVWLDFTHAAQPPRPNSVALAGLMRLVVWLVGAVVLTVAAASVWVGRLLQRRHPR